MRFPVAILSLGFVVLLAGAPARAGDGNAPAGAPAPGSPPAAPDTIDEALEVAGLTRLDLGWRARGTWDRWGPSRNDLSEFGRRRGPPSGVTRRRRVSDPLSSSFLARRAATRGLGSTRVISGRALTR